MHPTVTTAFGMKIGELHHIECEDLLLEDKKMIHRLGPQGRHLLRDKQLKMTIRICICSFAEHWTRDTQARSVRLHKKYSLHMFITVKENGNVLQAFGESGICH